METVLKSDLLLSDEVEVNIQRLTKIQEELILRVSGEYPAGEIIEETITNLKNLTVLKRDLTEFKLNLDANCVVWQNPKNQNL